MNVEIINVGSELLSGNVVNTNASYLSKKLMELGHDSFRQFTVDDNKERLSEIITNCLTRCDVLIITGGLGPTADDITKETVCDTLGLKLAENPVCKKHIDDYFRNFGKTPTENNYKQATAPDGAVIFKNPKGTACGIAIEFSGKHIILLPGPPSELKAIFAQSVVHYLKKLSHHAIVSHTLNVFGMGESAIETLIKPFCEKANPIVATYCSDNVCDVTVTATAQTESEAESLCTKTLISLRELLGDCVYASDSESLAQVVVNGLRSSGLKISTAESCTGGMLSQALTSVSHSSEVVEIGILAYSNRIKNEALSVPRDVLEECGAISPETAMYLAKNVRILSDSDIGIGITGNAGPTANENKPIGLVYIAIADKTKYLVKKLQLPTVYDREKIRSYATLSALDLVRKYVSARPQALKGMVNYNDEFTFTEEYLDGNYDNAAKNTLVEKPKGFDPKINFLVYQQEDNGDTATVDENKTEQTIDVNAYENNITLETEEETEEATQSRIDKLKEELSAKFSAFVKRIFPSRNDKTIDMIIKIVSIIAVIALLASSVAILSHFIHENSQRNIIEDARDDFVYEDNTKNGNDDKYSIFDPLIAQNPDIKAWIFITNTNIDNPVYQTTDNDYYLTHNMLKEKSKYGALFFDANNVIEKNGNSKNLTIYGHNMKDKSMFGTLNSYRTLSFYKKNPIIKLKTLYEQSNYIIFAAMITNASPEDDNGYVYNFTRSEFGSPEDFMNWIAEAKQRSLIDSKIEITENDEILTLSTCCYDFNDARFVVMAKKIDSNEATPDYSRAALNKNVRYPQAWYDKKGLPGYTGSDSSVSTSSKPSTSTSSDSSSDEQDGELNFNDFLSETESSKEESSSQTSASSTPNESTVCEHTALATPTNTNENNHSYACSKCGTILSSENHIFNQQNQTVKYRDATCGKAAVYYKTCLCGASGTETYEYGTPTGNHMFGDWITETEATETETGLRKRICSVCQYEETETIPAKGSDMIPTE